MSRHLIRQHIQEVLATVEGHIREGDRHISEQQERITWMEAKGYDTARSRELLTTFFAVRASHHSHMARLLRELGE